MPYTDVGSGVKGNVWPSTGRIGSRPGERDLGQDRSPVSSKSPHPSPLTGHVDKEHLAGRRDIVTLTVSLPGK